MMHLCPDCDSDLVHPIAEEVTARDDQWWVLLRCPNCEWLHDGLYSQREVEAFDVELDRGTEQLADDLARVMRYQMEEEADRLAVALAGDHVLPEDF